MFVHIVEQAVCSFVSAPVRGILNGIVWFIMIIAIGRGALYTPGRHYGDRRPVYMALSAILCVIAFGSYDFEPPVQITYIWAGTANLIFLRFFIGGRPRSGLWLPLFVLYAFVCGWGSESFSIPVSVALVVYAFRYRWHLLRSQFAGGIAYGLGTILLCVAPGNFTRLNGNVTIFHTFQLLFPLIPIVFIIGTTAILYFVRRHRARKNGHAADKAPLSGWVMMLLIIAVVNIIMATGLGLGSGVRMVTPALMALLILTLRVWQRAWRRMSVIVALAALWVAIICASDAFAAMEKHNLKYTLIQERYHDSADGRVYIPDLLFADNYREDLGMRRSYEGVERLTDPSKPDMKLLPESAARLPEECDTTMIVPLGGEAWLVVQSRHNPRDILVERKLDFGPFKKDLGIRILDLGEHSDILLDTTRNLRIGVYSNERPHLKVRLGVANPQ